MKRQLLISAVLVGISLLVVARLLPANAGSQTKSSEANPAISGTMVNGLRILPLPQGAKTVKLTVHRGDYIKFQFDDSISDPQLSIPALAIDQKLPRDLNQAPYFKMKQIGTYAFSLGEVQGHLSVIAYREAHYQELTSKAAAEIIRAGKPLILDVRTKPEYQQGHLSDSRLIPVQELHRRLGELADWKERDILIYCATGNRSTVASKILIDNGFKRIFNMRYGIYDWHRNKLPIVK